MNAAALRQRLADAVAAHHGGDGHGTTVWRALLDYAPHLGVSARDLYDAADAEALEIQAHARTGSFPRKGRAPPHSAAIGAAYERLGGWFVGFVREPRPFTSAAVLSLRTGAVTMFACADLYNRPPTPSPE